MNTHTSLLPSSKHILSRTACLAASLLICVSSLADAEIQGPCSAEPYRQFDFWLGEWEVTVPSGQVAGHNSITLGQQGCVLVEQWRGVKGTGGQSYNYYDNTLDQWRQVWVSPGIIIDYVGGLEGSAMVLKGKIHYQAQQAQFNFTGRWTPNDDGTVTQTFMQWNPATNAWDNWFTGIYRKVSTD